MAVASLQPIYERLNGADSYHPFAANTFADWSIEAGDIVNLKRGSDTYTSPVHTSHLSWRGSPQISMQTRGNKQLDSIGKATQKKFSRGGGAYRAAQTVGKKSSVYFQKPDPQLGSELNLNDVWIESDMLNSWDDIGELTWEELAEYTWMDFYGCKMYAWDGTKWVQIADEQKENYNFDLLRNTPAELTSIKADLSGAYSRILQTKGEILTEVVDTVNNVRSSITEQADRISLVVEGTGANAHIKPASIVASINAQTGQSAVLISANKVALDANNTTISDVISVQNNGGSNKGIYVDGKSVFGNSLYVYNHNLSAGNLVDLQYAFVSAIVASDVLTMSNAQGQQVTFGVSNNTLTITDSQGGTVTFSKATTLNPAWSGSVLTMKAQQTNGGVTTDVASKTLGFGNYGAHDIDLAVTDNGYPVYVDTTHIKCPVMVGTQNSGGANPTSRYTKDIQYYVGSILQEKTATANGDVTPDSGYIGLKKVTVNVSGGGTIDIPTNQIYTSGTSRGTKLTTLKTRYEQAKADSEFVMFRVDCGGSSKWYYMEP